MAFKGEEEMEEAWPRTLVMFRTGALEIAGLA